jgi:hypothetical protein
MRLCAIERNQDKFFMEVFQRIGCNHVLKENQRRYEADPMDIFVLCMWTNL